MTAFAAAGGVPLKTSDVDDMTRYSTAFGDDEANINVTSNSSSDAIADLTMGNAALALTSRSATQTERDLLQDAGVSALCESILAVDGLVVVAPKGNVLPSISIEDVAKMYAGEITNWSQVGGPDAPITLYGRNEGSLISEVFQTLVLDPAGLTLAADVQTFASDAELVSDGF